MLLLCPSGHVPLVMRFKKVGCSPVSRDSVGGLENFVRHWWIARYNYTSADKVYKYFKDLWNSGEIDSAKFLDELLSDTELYIKISSPVTEDFKQQEKKNYINL